MMGVVRGFVVSVGLVVAGLCDVLAHLPPRVTGCRHRRGGWFSGVGGKTDRGGHRCLLGMMRVVRGFVMSVGLVVVRFPDVEWFGSDTWPRTGRCVECVSPHLTPQPWLAW
jgi:hypothetical protein